MSVESAITTLASYRSKNTRKSQETYEKGLLILNSGKHLKFGDEQWAFLEQLALAAIDVGKLNVADQCLQKLGDKFPESPRVDVLTGIRMEASSQPPNTVLQFYDELLKTDPTHLAAWKRRICVLRRMNEMERAVEELNVLLDTFYTDLEGWLELADLYSSCHQYTYALHALSHALLLAPQNPFIFLQYAETAYTSGDIPLALKMFLIVIDMNEDENGETIPEGISVRAWLGIKLCTRRLISSPSTQTSPSNTLVPQNVNLIDELATERVLKCYSGERGAHTRNLISNWLT